MYGLEADSMERCSCPAFAAREAWWAVAIAVQAADRLGRARAWEGRGRARSRRVVDVGTEKTLIVDRLAKDV
jgi:hypothetical protein